MRTNLIIFFCALFAFTLTSCSSDDDNNNEPKDALVSFAKTGCKTITSLRSGTGEDDIASILGEESVVYEGTSDNCLFIKHNNVIFSCEATITVSATVEGNVITLKENGTSETNCLCPNDLTIKVGTLSERTYKVVLITEGLERTSFTINYSPKISGKVKIND